VKVTGNEHIHNSKALPKLVNYILKSNKIIGKIFADDDTYDGNNIFRCLADNKILPCIKVRKNYNINLKKRHILRNLSFISRENDLQKWKDSTIRYGTRWIVC
jgi:hypothetical protein